MSGDIYIYIYMCVCVCVCVCKGRGQFNMMMYRKRFNARVTCRQITSHFFLSLFFSKLMLKK